MSALLPLEYSEHAPNPQKGWRVLDGETWAFTTDGRSIAFRRVDSCEWEPGHLAGSPAVAGLMRDALAAPKQTVSLASLRAFLGEPATYKVVECSDCFGSGRESDADAGCECSRCLCEECGGTGSGVSLPTRRPVRIGGKPFDAVIVATALDRAQASGDARLGVVDFNGGAVVIAGDGWFAVAMGVRELDEFKSAPRIEDHADLGTAVPS